MTEYNSEFTHESNVGNSVDIRWTTEQLDARSENAKAGKCVTHDEASNEEDRLKEVITDEASSTISNSGCEDELHSLQDHWLKLSTFFRKVYHTILDGEKPPDEYECHVNIVRELIASDPHQLFARLEMDLQEFIIEIKLRQLELLNCVHTHEGPPLFIFCLIEDYNKLMFAANTLSPLLSQLEAEHLAKFNITWKGLNQHLFHKLVFTEPKIQKVLPTCISKLGKTNSKLSDFNKRLIRQFLTFDGQMIKIGAKWREAESSIIKYHQENSMLDAKQRMMKVNWELMKTQTKVFHEELKSSGISSDVSAEILNGGNLVTETNANYSMNYCICDDENKSSSAKDPSEQIKKLTDILKNIKVESAMQDQQCECCHTEEPHSRNPVLSNMDVYEEVNALKNIENSSEDQRENMKVLSHSNAEEKRYSNLVNECKIQPMSSSLLNGANTNEMKDVAANVNDSQKNNPQSPNSVSGSIDPYVPPSQRQVVHQQKHEHQKKIMNMMQSPQQKDIQLKIQQQLNEHQFLLKQQKSIDEIHAHLLQQHPMHMDKEMQKKVHMQMQQRLLQKHKQMEEKFHQQIQQHMQQHQEKPTVPASPPKTNLMMSSTSPTAGSPTASTVDVLERRLKYFPSVSISPPTAATNNCPTSTTAVASCKMGTINISKLSSGVTHKNSTTQTTTTPINGQNRIRHHPLPDVVKSASYVCPKHSEAGKQNAQNSGEDESLPGVWSDDDFSSERSNSPQRHCDCCYCEAFGSAPVSRNFQETRERLRLLLTKKKAKSIAASLNDEKSKNERSLSSSNISNSQPASQGTNKTKKENSVRDKKTELEYKGDKSIEEILDFIEGNKNRNLKRTAKKMRRKQRQLEEEERKRKEAEEAERLRLEELQRQEEEEKRRLEEERRRLELLKEQNRKKNKKKSSKLESQHNFKLAVQESKKNKNKNQNQPNKAKTSQIRERAMNNKVTNQKQTFAQQPPQKQSSQGQKKQNMLKQEAVKQQSKQKGAEKQKQTQPVKPAALKKMQQNQQSKNTNAASNESPNQPQMVTIKRVMQPNSNEPTVTITLRGPTPKDDKVLYTLLNGQMCQVKDDKNKKQTPDTSSGKKNKQTNNYKANNIPNSMFHMPNMSPSMSPIMNPSMNAAINPNINMSMNPSMNMGANSSMMGPKSTVNFNRNCTIMGNGVNSITERMDRLKLGPQPVPVDTTKKFVPSSAVPAELTTPTAIQINQAVNQLSARPTFPNNFDLENIKLPPGITITKVDPANVHRKLIQVKQPPPPPPPNPMHVRQTMIPSMPTSSSNVIVVDTTEKNNYYQSEELPISASKKKRRRRKKDNLEVNNEMTNSGVPYSATNGLPPRMSAVNAGMFGNPFMNAGYNAAQQQPAAIIQMNGSMVTIRNPALHQALAGQQIDYNDGPKLMKASDARKSNLDENIFAPPPEDLENGDVDEYERELEAFKRFCSQSVPAESKAKVNLNIEDIVLKKKGPVIGCS